MVEKKLKVPHALILLTVSWFPFIFPFFFFLWSPFREVGKQKKENDRYVLTICQYVSSYLHTVYVCITITHTLAYERMNKRTKHRQQKKLQTILFSLYIFPIIIIIFLGGGSFLLQFMKKTSTPKSRKHMYYC